MNVNSPLEDLFSSEFMRWRYFQALSTSYLLQLMIAAITCSCIKTLCFDNVWNPAMWIYYFVNGIFQPSLLFQIFLPIMCYIILIRIHVHSYSAAWWIPERRFQYMSQFFQLKKIFYSVGLVFLSACLFQYYAYLIHPDLSSLTIQCGSSDGGACINHQALLVLFFGLAFGCRLSLKYFLHNYKAIQFPVAQPNLLVRLKSKLRGKTVVDACLLFDVNFGFVLFVGVFYLLLGGIISQWIGPFVGVSKSEDTSLFWSIFATILDARFIITITACLILLAYNLHCFFLIFQEFVCKRIELPICSEEPLVSGSEPLVASNWTLNSGMVSSCEHLQLLAFKHFRDIAMDQTAWGASYRAQIYAISQPGGHPRNWQSIVNPCLNLLRKFTDRLKQHNFLEEKTSTLRPSVNPLLHQTAINKNQQNQPTRFSFKEKWCQVKESFKQLPFVWYLLSDIPDSKNRQIFAESQSVIWAVEGLSNLVATSYADDVYGVVQKNISDILTCLIQMQMIVEKINRVLPYRRVSHEAKPQKSPYDHQLRRSLRMTLRTSLYIITDRFKESIREIPVAEDVKNKLNSYLIYQEG